MPWPYDDEPDAMPDLRAIQGGLMAPPMMPSASEPDYLAEMQAPQEQMPDDYWARIAQGTGGQGPFGPMRLGNKPTGLEVLLALASGFANAKTGQATQRISETDQRNQRAREAAKFLATKRHEDRRMENQANLNLRNIIASRKPGAPPDKGPAKVVIDPKTGKRRYAYESDAVAGGYEAPEPAAPSMIPMVMPGGELGWGNPKSPPPGSAPPIPRGSKLPASALLKYSEELNTIAQTDDVLALYRPEFVGPVSGGVRGAVGAKTGVGLRPGEAKFRSAVATYANKARNILFGSALTATEKEEAYKQLPDPANPSDVFEANIEMTRNNLRRANRLTRETYEGSGYSLSNFPAAGGGGGGGPDDKVKIVRDGVPGTVSRKYLRPTDKVVE